MKRRKALMLYEMVDLYVLHGPGGTRAAEWPENHVRYVMVKARC